MNVITLPPKDREQAIQRALRAMQDFMPGKPVNVKLGVARPGRSSKQCRYLWGVAYKMLADFAGYEIDDVAEWCLCNYFGEREVRVPKSKWNPQGIEYRPIRTTTTDADGNRDVLSQEDFWAYVEWIQRVAAKQGVIIPDPEGE